MVIPSGVNIPMPRPFGGTIPVITRSSRPDGKPGTVYTVQFVGEIGPVSQYLELLQVLDTATSDDQVKLVIDSPGGDVYTAQLIIERMDECNAQVITVASGLVASAATFVWCAGKVKEVGRWARFMFHSSLHGDWGKSLSIQENATELVKYMATILTNEMKAGILLGAEVAKILRDKADVEISGATMRRRLARLTGEDGAGIPASAPAAPVEQPVEPVEQPAEEPVEQPADTPVAPADIFNFDAYLRAEGVDTTPQPEQPAQPAVQPDYANPQPDENQDDGATDAPVTPATPEDRCGRRGKKQAGKRRALQSLFSSIERLLAEDDTTADSDVTATPEPEEAKPDQGDNATLPPEKTTAPMKEVGQTGDATLTKKVTPADVFDFDAYLRAEGIEPTPETDTPAPAPETDPAEAPVEQPEEAPQASPTEQPAPVASWTGRYW